ncbi:DUF2487 family protein [Cohnella sp. JJ-181]|uniref:DUF2487 family protein n=1 Tax=Cohnella rhizoplanae TaxID=2974897 RepID=UPI0022FF7F67|nr:DUF2487 family protein [Cohnella sp. JJ-181]CAI6080975.1 hypothetical protein COHCIP112018_03157 [Cohnella sp. JJ-181]
MKFSEFDDDNWGDLQLYLDTALLPVSGLSGGETPPAAGALVGAAGDWLAPIESAFRGRTVTYPAHHYIGPGDEGLLERLCERLRSGGFKHVVVVSGRAGWDAASVPSADLFACPESEADEPDADALRRAVSDMWKRAAQG